jgi:hypothetical protein
MKDGFWNYTEPIKYRVVYVQLFPVKEPVLHWQNAFVGEIHQAVQVYHFRPDGECRPFLISNQDGSGIKKMEKGGGPDSQSWHIVLEACVIGNEVPEPLWNTWSEFATAHMEGIVEQWQEENYPEQFKRLQALKQTIKNFPKR